MKALQRIAVVGFAASAVLTGGSPALAATPPTIAPAVHLGTPAPRAGYVVTTAWLNIRSGPGPNFRKVTSLRRGSRVTADTAEVNGFRRISSGHWASVRCLTEARR